MFYSERSPNGGILGASGAEIIGYKSQPPNNTIMIRGLAQHITENDVSIKLFIIYWYSRTCEGFFENSNQIDWQ